MLRSLYLGCLWLGMVMNSTPNPPLDSSIQINDCIHDERNRYCYGGQEGENGSWEERDWSVTVESLDTGHKIEFGEPTALYENVWFLALLGDRQGLLVIERQRYVSEFSVMVYESTELVWIDWDEGIFRRANLEFRPVDAIAFDHRLWLFDEANRGYEVLDDGTIQSLPALWEQRDGDVLITQTTVRWQTPEGYAVDSPVVGLYQLVWTTKTGRVFRLPAVVHPTVSGVPDGGETNEPFAISASGFVFLDGHPYLSGFLVREPGIHRFSIEGANGYKTTFDVVLHPFVLGLPDSGITTKTIRIYANASMMLNGIPYSSGWPITQSNRYELTLTGVNGYTAHYVFLLAPSVSGVRDNSTYDEPLEIMINGKGLLNGVMVEGIFVIDQSGEYELALMLDDRVYSRLIFTLNLPPNKTTDTKKEGARLLQIGLGLTAVIGLFLVLKKR